MLKVALTTAFVVSVSAFGGSEVQARDLSAVVEDVATPHDMENVIIVPFQGTWVQGPNTLIFTAGNSWNGDWIVGNVIGGGGQTNQYLWKQSNVTSGVFFFETNQGRQGPVYVTLSNNNKTMTWRFGAETSVFTRVN